MAMVRFRPFEKLLRVVVAWSLAYGGMQAFTVVFLKTALQMADSKVLLITGASYLGGLSSLWVLGTRLDGLGSKPVLTFCFTVWIAVLTAWARLPEAFCGQLGVLLSCKSSWPARRTRANVQHAAGHGHHSADGTQPFLRSSPSSAASRWVWRRSSGACCWMPSGHGKPTPSGLLESLQHFLRCGCIAMSLTLWLGRRLGAGGRRSR
jgi:hypothetical protein